MNLPNKLTISRIVLTFIFMSFLFSKGVIFKVLALLTFTAAAFTDFLDGFIAKRKKMITYFGMLMDPIADKILVLAAFLAFVEMKLIPAWMVVIILFRELTITGMRIFALSKKKIISADEGGKHKTASQVFAIFLILIFLVFKEAGLKIFKFWNPAIEELYKNAIFILMFITVILTAISGISYLFKNKDIYMNAESR